MHRSLSKFIATAVAFSFISVGVAFAKPAVQLGPTTESTPVVTSLGAGTGHTCMVRDGNVWCTGDNTHGQLGTGDRKRTSAFAQSLISHAKSVSAGGDTTCAILEDNTATCWGNVFGVGDSDIAIPLPLQNVISLSVATEHACAVLANHSAWCWGNNGSGRLGNGSRQFSLHPVRVKLPNVSFISAGSVHTCAIKLDQTVWCWGSNGSYRLGLRGDRSRLTPQQVFNIHATSISAGGNFTCIVNSAQRVQCWGKNSYRQLGVKITKPRAIPSTLALRNVMSVSTGDEFACATTATPQTYCWGRARYGQLANNSNIYRSTPQLITPITEIGSMTTVETGASHACAITTTIGTLWCWGLGSTGQLGDTSRTNAMTGVVVWPNGVRLAPIGTDTAVTLVLAGDISCNNQREFVYGIGASGNQCGDQSTAALITRINPQAVVSLGDLQYENATIDDFLLHYDTTWGAFKSITYPVRGNHEYLTRGAAGYVSYFGNVSGSYWTTNAGGWRVIGVDSWCVGVVTEGCSASSHQTKWLSEQLAIAHTENKCSMVVMHHPPYSSGNYATSSARPLWQAAVTGGTDVMFTGHDHIYERFQPLGADGTPSATGTALFISGLGGAPAHQIVTPAIGSMFQTITEHGVVKLELNPSSYTWSFISAATDAVIDTGTASCTP